ncbi:ABC transporter permease [Jiangella rhizosphaerae]|uniref:ABC transporter permease n=1 Tax=Jiangella rhizosphaerae TaxID=2293569 RepID=A0A418KPD9_9ACTN|nr:ABC transporter permease [Jiangella rhizosphaerae]RIQ21226.1 ABC transporter permease [Jiangella rhizosphaerae]
MSNPTTPDPGPTPAATAAPDDAQGMTVVARTQAQMVRRRFFRHRAALAGLTMLVLIVLLAFSSIGFANVPGWWDKDYWSIATVENGGRPTLSVVPTWLGGDGMHLGEHPFGQDNVGKDYFALTMRGVQQSLTIAFIVGLVGTFIGTLIGATAGYFRGRVEAVLMRFTDVMITIPLLVIAAVLGRRYGDSGIVVLGLVIGLVTWTGLARLVRGEFLSLREKEFVEAARAAGTSARRIIVKHMLPNIVGVIIVAATLAIAAAILLEAALSFLGFGVQDPDTSLGKLISTYQTAFSTRPWLFWFPGVFIIAIALSVNFIGDGLRDAFDPRQNRVRD